MKNEFPEYVKKLTVKKLKDYLNEPERHQDLLIKAAKHELSEREKGHKEHTSKDTDHRKHSHK